MEHISISEVIQQRSSTAEPSVFPCNNCNILLRFQGPDKNFEQTLKVASLEHTEHEESQNENNRNYQVLVEKMGALSGWGEGEA